MVVLEADVAVTPRSQGPNGPVWDATDEIYITYDKDLNRVYIATGEHDVWNDERAYQRAGTGRYEDLRDLGDRARVAVGRLRPAGRAPARPPVRVDHNGNNPGPRPDGGARRGPEYRGGGATPTRRHARSSTDGGRVSQRPDERTAGWRHRHCGGCTEHGSPNRGWTNLILRAFVAWILGWDGLQLAGVGVPLGRYAILTLTALAVGFLFRPFWREIARR